MPIDNKKKNNPSPTYLSKYLFKIVNYLSYKRNNIDNSWLVITPNYVTTFYFNETVLSKIGQIRKKHHILRVDRFLLSRWFSHLNSEAKFLSEGLTFCSFYKEIPIIKSIIYPEGRVCNEVNSKYLKNPQLLQEITVNHFWLVEQLLLQNTLKNRLKREKDWRYWVGWIVAIVIITITVIGNLDGFIANVWLCLLVPVTLWLLQWGFRRLLDLFL